MLKIEVEITQDEFYSVNCIMDVLIERGMQVDGDKQFLGNVVRLIDPYGTKITYTQIIK